MSRHRTYRIDCDGDDCGQYISMCRTRKEAEQAARELGWSLGREWDFCEVCRKVATWT